MSRQRLERAAAGHPEAGVTVLRGRRPPWLDGEGVRATLAPFMAAFMVAAAILRARIANTPLDLLGVGLRTLAVAFVVRALVELLRLARRLRSDAKASQHALAWDEQGLLWKSPDGAHYLPKSALAAIATSPARMPGSPKRRARAVWLVCWPGQAATPCLTLPPYFASESEGLVARLERWLGEAQTAPVSAPQAEATTLAERARSGQAPEGASVVHNARRYLHHAPWGWLLAAVFAQETYRAAPQGFRDALGLPLLAMAAASLLAPLSWWWMVSRRTRGTSGIALVLTASEAIALVPGGAVSVAWASLSEVDVLYRARWSPWTGGYTVHRLELRGRDGSFLRYDDALLDTPVEALAALARALRTASSKASTNRAQSQA